MSLPDDGWPRVFPPSFRVYTPPNPLLHPHLVPIQSIERTAGSPEEMDEYPHAPYDRRLPSLRSSVTPSANDGPAADATTAALTRPSTISSPGGTDVSGITSMPSTSSRLQEGAAHVRSSWDTSIKPISRTSSTSPNASRAPSHDGNKRRRSTTRKRNSSTGALPALVDTAVSGEQCERIELPPRANVRLSPGGAMFLSLLHDRLKYDTCTTPTEWGFQDGDPPEWALRAATDRGLRDIPRPAHPGAFGSLEELRPPGPPEPGAAFLKI